MIRKDFRWNNKDFWIATNSITVRLIDEWGLKLLRLHNLSCVQERVMAKFYLTPNFATRALPQIEHSRKSINSETLPALSEKSPTIFPLFNRFYHHVEWKSTASWDCLFGQYERLKPWSSCSPHSVKSDGVHHCSKQKSKFSRSSVGGKWSSVRINEHWRLTIKLQSKDTFPFFRLPPEVSNADSDTSFL